MNGHHARPKEDNGPTESLEDQPSEFFVLAKKMESERASLRLQVITVAAERDRVREECTAFEVENRELKSRNTTLENEIKDSQTLESLTDRRTKLVTELRTLDQKAAENFRRHVQNATDEHLAFGAKIRDLENSLEENLLDPGYQLPTFSQLKNDVHQRHSEP